MRAVRVLRLLKTADLKRVYRSLVIAGALLFASLFVQNGFAQVVVPGDLCPPGYELVPPNECVPISASPSPEQEKPESIVLVPGLITSLNLNITLRNGGSGGTWGYAPGAVQIYRALTERLEQAGIPVTVAHYDWRKPAAENRHYLVNAIDSAKAASDNGKVDIVSHSFGGLVARNYIQSAGYRDDVDQLITLGTPHKGAADAYLVLEGGLFPDRWGVLVRTYANLVEAALVTQDLSSLPRPQTFRTYFPSLQDLLPIDPFVTLAAGTTLPFGSLAGPDNLFLKHLEDTREESFGSEAEGKVELVTFAGSGLGTLNQIALNSPDQRSLVDLLMRRWRDGHPTPDPPPVDSEEGDKTVLLSSARLDSTPILSNIEHDKLPEEAQEEILAALDNTGHIDLSGAHLVYELPESALGILVLSPVVPKIIFPDGSSFLCDGSKEEGGIACLTESAYPEGMKLLFVTNPTPGSYEIMLETVGVGGEYDLVVSAADTDGDAVTVISGAAEAGINKGYQMTLGTGGSDIFVEDIEIEAVLHEIKDAAERAHHTRHLHGRDLGGLMSTTNHALRDLDNYDKRLDQGKSDRARRELESYYRNIDAIEQVATRANLLEIVQLVERVRRYSPRL